MEAVHTLRLARGAADALIGRCEAGASEERKLAQEYTPPPPTLLVPFSPTAPVQIGRASLPRPVQIGRASLPAPPPYDRVPAARPGDPCEGRGVST